MKKIENISIGMPAVVVVKKIADTNLIDEVDFILYTTQKPYEKIPRGSDVPIDLLLRHSGQTDEARLPVKREEIYDFYDRYTNKIRQESAIGICSAVKMRQSVFHISMIDFHCDISADCLARIKDFLIFIGQKEGAILESGRSYHYYGMKLLTIEQWIEFMGKCLLFCTYAGQRYLGHSLINGFCTLRISSKALHNCIPKVVSVL